ncbi:uncharacterized protein J3D65DRAFT_291794 [Phyllosticta citribraziliensis]|uniref:Uncharacterized protein n=1 Tax=Phyllosticta citribraziliensis TaxID=989973 RepID=A0ABR1LWZ2_9PEZI
MCTARPRRGPNRYAVGERGVGSHLEQVAAVWSSHGASSVKPRWSTSCSNLCQPFAWKKAPPGARYMRRKNEIDPNAACRGLVATLQRSRLIYPKRLLMGPLEREQVRSSPRTHRQLSSIRFGGIAYGKTPGRFHSTGSLQEYVLDNRMAPSNLHGSPTLSPQHNCTTIAFGVEIRLCQSRGFSFDLFSAPAYRPVFFLPLVPTACSIYSFVLGF